MMAKFLRVLVCALPVGSASPRAQPHHHDSVILLFRISKWCRRCRRREGASALSVQPDLQFVLQLQLMAAVSRVSRAEWGGVGRACGLCRYFPGETHSLPALPGCRWQTPNGGVCREWLPSRCCPHCGSPLHASATHQSQQPLCPAMPHMLFHPPTISPTCKLARITFLQFICAPRLVCTTPPSPARLLASAAAVDDNAAGGRDCPGRPQLPGLPGAAARCEAGL